MNSIKLFLTFFILISTFYIGTANAQWWSKGGNLLWPYGEVTIKNNLNVSDSLIFERDGKKISLHLMSYEEEGAIVYEPVLEILTIQSGSNDFGRLQINYQGMTYLGMESGVATSFSMGANGRLVVNDGATNFQVALVPNRKAIQLNNSVYVMTGTGSPEGSVSAPVGSLYLRSDGSANTSMYVKESGVSVTGWVAK